MPNSGGFTPKDNHVAVDQNLPWYLKSVLTQLAISNHLPPPMGSPCRSLQRSDTSSRSESMPKATPTLLAASSALAAPCYEGAGGRLLIDIRDLRKRGDLFSSDLKINVTTRPAHGPTSCRCGGSPEAPRGMLGVQQFCERARKSMLKKSYKTTSDVMWRMFCDFTIF